MITALLAAAVVQIATPPPKPVVIVPPARQGRVTVVHVQGQQPITAIRLSKDIQVIHQGTKTTTCVTTGNVTSCN